MLSAPKLPSSNSGPVIGGVFVVMLAAIAIALPPSPIESSQDNRGFGSLESASLFSDGIAELNAQNGYGHMVLDLTQASVAKDSLWRKNLAIVSARRYPVWGWIEGTRDDAAFIRMVKDLPLAGLYVHGGDATLYGNERPVIEVSDAATADGNVAVLVDFKTYMASGAGDYARPVLRADSLSELQVEQAMDHARKLAGEDGVPTLLVARVPVP